MRSKIDAEIEAQKNMAMSILFGVGPNHEKGPRQKSLLGEFLNAKLKNINSFLSKSKVTKYDI